MLTAILHRRYQSCPTLTNEEAEATCLKPYPSPMADKDLDQASFNHEAAPGQSMGYTVLFPSDDRKPIDEAEVAVWVEYKLILELKNQQILNPKTNFD